MSRRNSHMHDLPTIAKAIQEYKTTYQTQKECADKFGIPYKVFSYYFLNGFKKNQKVGGGLIPEETPYQKKSKTRANNYYDVVLVGKENVNQPPLQPQIHPPPVNHNYVEQPNKNIPQISIKQNISTSSSSNLPISSDKNKTLSSIREKFNAATIVKDGKKKIDLNGFIL